MKTLLCTGLLVSYTGTISAETLEQGSDRKNRNHQKNFSSVNKILEKNGNTVKFKIKKEQKNLIPKNSSQKNKKHSIFMNDTTSQ